MDATQSLAASTSSEPQPLLDYRTMRRSTSQRRAFRTCGYKFLHKYGHGWRRQINRGTYAFGDVMHHLAGLIALRMLRDEAFAVELFGTMWLPHKTDPTRSWTKRGPWELLDARGRELVKKMVRELPQVLGKPDPEHLEERIEYNLGGFTELAIPDFYGPVNPPVEHQWCVSKEILLPKGIVDFKSGDRRYVETSAELDEQLTDYQMAEESKSRPVDVLALCVLIYTVEPQIQWIFAPARTRADLDTFVANAQHTDQQIRDGIFVRNDRACDVMGECDFKGLCYGSQRERVAKELVQKHPSDDVVDYDEV